MALPPDLSMFAPNYQPYAQALGFTPGMIPSLSAGPGQALPPQPVWTGGGETHGITMGPNGPIDPLRWAQISAIPSPPIGQPAQYSPPPTFNVQQSPMTGAGQPPASTQPFNAFSVPSTMPVPFVGAAPASTPPVGTEAQSVLPILLALASLSRPSNTTPPFAPVVGGQAGSVQSSIPQVLAQYQGRQQRG